MLPLIVGFQNLVVSVVSQLVLHGDSYHSLNPSPNPPTPQPPSFQNGWKFLLEKGKARQNRQVFLEMGWVALLY